MNADVEYVAYHYPRNGVSVQPWREYNAVRGFAWREQTEDHHVPENTALDYASPKPRRRSGRVMRRALLGASAVVFLLGCPLLGFCLSFLTGLHYIDGGEGTPHTPADQRTFAIAAMLPYVGVALSVSAIALLVYLEYRDRSKVATTAK